jgi:NADH dehydrogenase FAD-containing subunit
MGLTDSSGWAPVDPVTYASTLPGYENIHIIGDSQGTGQPKSGHMANAQAKVCADAIIRLASGAPTHTAERLENLTTNSACYSPITFDKASWLTAVYRYDDSLGEMSLSQLGEVGDWTSKNFDNMFDWSDNLFADTFN